MKKDSYYLALSVSHNSSAALMKNGEILIAVCEERFCREKNYIGYPKQSIDYCLKKANIQGCDIERVAYTTIDNQGILVKAKTNTKFSIKDYHDYYGNNYYGRKLKGLDVSNYLKWLRDDSKFNSDIEYFDFSYLTDEVINNSELDIKLFRDESAKTLATHLGIPIKKIEFLDHHTCHAYYAYFGSPVRDKDCIVLTMDGWGDGRNQTVWKVSKNRFLLLASSSQNDIGRIYKLATLLLGMRPDEHEFKVMGLAPYAKLNYVEKVLHEIENICDVKDMKIISKNRPSDLYQFLKDIFLTHRFDNIAGAVQLYTEKIACKLVGNIIEKTGITNFVLGGGIAMNIKMNQAIMEMDSVNNLYVCGSNGDESLSIGGCYLLNENSKYLSSPLNHLYLGYDSIDDMNSFDIEALSKKFTVKTNVEKAVIAKLLKEGDIVGIIRSKAEFGARALGNRSILANPSIRESIQKINEAIKNRDFWMPFALSILEEKHQEYIENPKNIKSPLMTISFNAKLDKYRQIEAGTHPYDKTVRPQFVSKDNAKAYHDLITEFFNITGVPALLNTSFNLHGEPIVNTVQDAIRTFELSGLDHLYINDKYLISKLR